MNASSRELTPVSCSRDMPTNCSSYGNTTRVDAIIIAKTPPPSMPEPMSMAQNQLICVAGGFSGIESILSRSAKGVMLARFHRFHSVQNVFLQDLSHFLVEKRAGFQIPQKSKQHPWNPALLVERGASCHGKRHLSPFWPILSTERRGA